MDTHDFLHRLSFTGSFILFSIQSFSQYIQEGPYNPSTITEQTAGCLSCPGSEWQNLTDASMPDNLFTYTILDSNAHCFQTSCYCSRALEPENFGFYIPANAVITGVVAEVLRKASDFHSIRDSLVQLLVGGVPDGNAKADTSYWPLNPSYTVYGDSTDLWGTLLTPAAVNAIDFGLFIKPVNMNTALPTTASVDHVRLTVYYGLPSGITEHQSSDELPFIYQDVLQHALIIKNSFAKQNGEVYILNSLGQIVFKKKSSVHSIRIDITDFSDGIYLIKFHSGETFYSRKFAIVNR